MTVYDIDGEYTTAQTVAQLHSLGPDIKVIGYIDAGVYEDYRSDAGSFLRSVIGNNDVGWEGSYWLDVRQWQILEPIMKRRMKEWCKDKGFDAVEPDETKAGELWQYFDWTLNEQCLEYDECDNIINAFVLNGKAAFNIEYDATPDCSYANSKHMNSVRRDLNLVGPLHSSYRFSPCIPYTKPNW